MFTAQGDLVFVAGDLEALAGLLHPHHGHIGQQLLVGRGVDPRHGGRNLLKRLLPTKVRKKILQNIAQLNVYHFQIGSCSSKESEKEPINLGLNA